MKRKQSRHLSSGNEHTTADRRREERRAPEVEPTYLWVSIDKRYSMRLLDISSGGVGVEVDCPADTFEVGFQVKVSLPNGERRLASIANVNEMSSNRSRLGLQWE